MSKFSAVAAGAVMIALAAIPAFALTQAANAAEPAARIAVGNLDNPTEAAAFNARVNEEADRVCKDMEKAPNTGSKIRVSHASCVADFRAEALSQLSSVSRTSVQLAATTNTATAAGR